MRDAVRERPEAINDEATNMPASTKQFENSGLPVGPPSPSPPSNGFTHGNGQRGWVASGAAAAH
jgi:hypothetical protein